MSAKASPRPFTTYGTLCFSHRDFTNGAILYRLCRGIVGNKLKRTVKVLKHNPIAYLKKTYIIHHNKVKLPKLKTYCVCEFLKVPMEERNMVKQYFQLQQNPCYYLHIYNQTC